MSGISYKKSVSVRRSSAARTAQSLSLVSAAYRRPCSTCRVHVNARRQLSALSQAAARGPARSPCIFVSLRTVRTGPHSLCASPWASHQTVRA